MIIIVLKYYNIWIIFKAWIYEYCYEWNRSKQSLIPKQSIFLLWKGFGFGRSQINFLGFAQASLSFLLLNDDFGWKSVFSIYSFSFLFYFLLYFFIGPGLPFDHIGFVSENFEFLLIHVKNDLLLLFSFHFFLLLFGCFDSKLVSLRYSLQVLLLEKSLSLRFW